MCTCGCKKRQTFTASTFSVVIWYKCSLADATGRWSFAVASTTNILNFPWEIEMQPWTDLNVHLALVKEEISQFTNNKETVQYYSTPNTNPNPNPNPNANPNSYPNSNPNSNTYPNLN